MVGKIIILVHLVAVLLIFVLIFFKRLKVDKLMAFNIIFLPILGEVLIVIEHVRQVRGTQAKKISELEAMKEVDDDYTNIQLASKEDNMVVPIEDALILNDSAVRRSLIMDVLMQDTKQYTGVINQARLNDDVEVVHYAITAMVELSDEYESKSKLLRGKIEAEPDRSDYKDEYIDFLEEYIHSGVAEGSILNLQKQYYEEMIEDRFKRLKLDDDMVKLSRIKLDKKEYDQAIDLIEKYKSEHPHSQKMWINEFRYYYENGRPDKIDEMVYKVINSIDDDVYYSRKIRKIARFWNANDNDKAYKSNLLGLEGSFLDGFDLGKDEEIEDVFLYNENDEIV